MEKLAKAQHQVNKWLHSHHLFTPFRCHKKATVAQKAQHQVRPIGRCSELGVFWGRPRSKVVSPPPPCLWLCASIGRRSSGGSDALTTPEAWSASSASTRGAFCKFYYTCHFEMRVPTTKVFESGEHLCTMSIIRMDSIFDDKERIRRCDSRRKTPLTFFSPTLPCVCAPAPLLHSTLGPSQYWEHLM